MRNIKIAVALIATIAAAPAAAQKLQVRELPSIGEENVAAVGGNVWEQYQYDGVPGVIIDAPVRANWGSAELVDLPAGTRLIVQRQKKLRACREVQTLNNLPVAVTMWKDCLIDTDGDSKFDKVSYTDGGFSKSIEPPVSYSLATVELTGTVANNFRKVIMYMGADASSLKLSYREFSNDTARPAFTEELSLPLGSTFPQNVAVKDHVITILGIDGMGLKYKLVK